MPFGLLADLRADAATAGSFLFADRMGFVPVQIRFLRGAVRQAHQGNPLGHDLRLAVLCFFLAGLASRLGAEPGGVGRLTLGSHLASSAFWAW